MSEASQHLDRAAKATDEVQELASRALRRLETAFNGRIVNGYGIYSDPSRQRDALRLAITDLNAALAQMTATHWPLSADYDAAE